MASLLRISSKDRDLSNSVSSSDFNISFNNANNVQSIKRIVVKTVTIPNSFYNVNIYNNTFQYKLSAVSSVFVDIPIGQYTISEFITAFNLALAGIGMTASISSLTSKLSFTTTTPIRFVNLADGNEMAEILGIHTSSTTEVTSYTSANLPNLSGITEVYVVSNKLSDNSNMIAKDALSLPVIICVPTTAPFGGNTVYECNSPELDEVEYKSQRFGKNLQHIDIRLIDKDSHPLDLQGLPFEMILKIYYGD